MEITVKDAETGEVYRTQPTRDVAYFIPRLVDDVESRLCHDRLSAGERERMTAAGEGPVDLTRAFACFMIFMDLAKDPDLKTPFEAIKRSGFLDAKPAARGLVLEKFAQCCLGAFWAGIRSSVMEGECPPVLSNLRRRGLELLEQLTPTDAA